MINPTFSSTITVLHKEKAFNEDTKRNEIKWSRFVLQNCYYKMQDTETLNGNVLSQTSTYTVRIPYNKGIPNISLGDIIVKGEIELEENEDDIISDVQGKRVTDLIQKYKPDCFTVRTVSKNMEISEGAHYKLTGM